MTSARCISDASGSCRWCRLPMPLYGYRDCEYALNKLLRITAGGTHTIEPPATMPLGDWTEAMLQSLGITKDRYVAAKQLFGLSPTCDCDARREWLNRVSEWWRGQAT